MQVLQLPDCLRLQCHHVVVLPPTLSSHSNLLFFRLSQFLLAPQSKPVLERLRVYLFFQIYRFAYLRKVSRKFPYLELEMRKFREEGRSVSFELLDWRSALVLVVPGLALIYSLPFWTAYPSFHGSFHSLENK